jgi:hypothetical protein
MPSDEQTVYDFCTEFFKTKQVSDATFQAIKDKIDERGFVEVIASCRRVRDGFLVHECRSLSPRTVQLRAGLASAHYFDIFGVKAVLGRTFAPGEDQLGKEKGCRPQPRCLGTAIRGPIPR